MALRKWKIVVQVGGRRMSWNEIHAANPWTAIMRALRGLLADDDPEIVQDFKDSRFFIVEVTRVK